MGYNFVGHIIGLSSFV